MCAVPSAGRRALVVAPQRGPPPPVSAGTTEWRTARVQPCRTARSSRSVRYHQVSCTTVQPISGTPERSPVIGRERTVVALKGLRNRAGRPCARIDRDRFRERCPCLDRGVWRDIRVRARPRFRRGSRLHFRRRGRRGRLRGGSRAGHGRRLARKWPYVRRRPRRHHGHDAAQLPCPASRHSGLAGPRGPSRAAAGEGEPGAGAS